MAIVTSKPVCVGGGVEGWTVGGPSLWKDWGKTTFQANGQIQGRKIASILHGTTTGRGKVTKHLGQCREAYYPVRACAKQG